MRARRAKINLLGDRAPPFSKGLDERRPTPAPLSQGLDPALDFWIFCHYKLSLIHGIQQTKRFTFVAHFY